MQKNIALILTILLAPFAAAETQAPAAEAPAAMVRAKKKIAVEHKPKTDSAAAETEHHEGAAPLVHVVGKDETIDKVIRKTKPNSPYKLKVLREAFAEANKAVLAGLKGRRLEPGMVLVVPPDSELEKRAFGTIAKPADADTVISHAHDSALKTPEANEPEKIVSPVTPPAVIPVAATESVQAINAAENTAENATQCKQATKDEIAALFDRWNASLKTGDARKVVANYATPSILLPTLSNMPRFTMAEKEEYFRHFLERRPTGKIDDRLIETSCDSAVDAGLYTFRFNDGAVVKARYSFTYKKVAGEWLISSHHSSQMPEKNPVGHAAAAATAPARMVERNENVSKPASWVRFP